MAEPPSFTFEALVGKNAGDASFLFGSGHFKDQATSLAVSSKFVMLGTKKGRLHVLDMQCNPVSRFALAAAAINAVSFDLDREENAVGASEDGKVVVQSLFGGGQHAISDNLQGKSLTAVALDPSFSQRQRVAVGTRTGEVILIERKFFYNSRRNLYNAASEQGATVGPILDLQWHSDRLIAFATSQHVRVVEVNSGVMKQVIGAAPGDRHLYWSGFSKLVCSSGKSVDVVHFPTLEEAKQVSIAADGASFMDRLRITPRTKDQSPSVGGTSGSNVRGSDPSGPINSAAALYENATATELLRAQADASLTIDGPVVGVGPWEGNGVMACWITTKKAVERAKRRSSSSMGSIGKGKGKENLTLEPGDGSSERVPSAATEESIDDHDLGTASSTSAESARDLLESNQPASLLPHWEGEIMLAFGMWIPPTEEEEEDENYVPATTIYPADVHTLSKPDEDAPNFANKIKFVAMTDLNQDKNIRDTPDTNDASKLYYVIGPFGIARVKPLTQEDHIEYLDRQGRFKEALELSKASGRDRQTRKITHRYLSKLMNEKDLDALACLICDLRPDATGGLFDRTGSTDWDEEEVKLWMDILTTLLNAKHECLLRKSTRPEGTPRGDEPPCLSPVLVLVPRGPKAESQALDGPVHDLPIELYSRILTLYEDEQSENFAVAMTAWPLALLNAKDLALLKRARRYVSDLEEREDDASEEDNFDYKRGFSQDVILEGYYAFLNKINGASQGTFNDLNLSGVYNNNLSVSPGRSPNSRREVPNEEVISLSLRAGLLLRRNEALSEINSGTATHLLVERIRDIFGVNFVNAAKALAVWRDAVGVKPVIDRLESLKMFGEMSQYFSTLNTLDMRAAAPFNERMIELYADYDYAKLLPLLRSTVNYNLEKTYALCEKRRFVPEMIFLLSRMGANKKALQIMIDYSNDVTQAIEFAKEQDDAELWQDLINFSIDKPDYVRALLLQAGSHIDPLNVVPRIPETMEIPGLREAVIKVLADSQTKSLLQKSCAQILQDDVVELQRRLKALQNRGAWSDPHESVCAICNGPIWNETTVENHPNIVIFYCGHRYHQDCLTTMCQARASSMATKKGRSTPVESAVIHCVRCQSQLAKRAGQGGATGAPTSGSSPFGGALLGRKAAAAAASAANGTMF
eukprot:Clim_evm23s99 gene=Clim_evmTU23s99